MGMLAIPVVWLTVRSAQGSKTKHLVVSEKVRKRREFSNEVVAVTCLNGL